jgi:deoxyribodipyrimidine photo-lyase
MSEVEEQGRSNMMLPLPSPGDEVAWVNQYLGHLCSDTPAASGRFAGTQQAADIALQAFDVSGYAKRRNDVWPVSKRGASGLSPWIRHGLLSLPDVWHAVGGHGFDSRKFRDELLWQEYARHVYARLGTANRQSLRYQPVEMRRVEEDPWDRSMKCVDLCMTELETDGWLVNQTRMWMAAHWSVRHGAPWQDGEDVFFTHLLDGSRAANRLGWQWTTGAGTGRVYGFSRWQVNKRSTGVCDSCVHRDDCPIEDWPAEPAMEQVDDTALLRHDPDTRRTIGPLTPLLTGSAEAVWLTAESLGDSDPALAAHPDLPVVFVFDAPLLARLRLSGKRLVFLTQRLAELGAGRDVEISLGDPTGVLQGRAVATTFAPVPGWATRAAAINPVEVHPWPWLRRPDAGSLTSYTNWVKRVGN